jgi:hypothetical protein
MVENPEPKVNAAELEAQYYFIKSIGYGSILLFHFESEVNPWWRDND